MFVDRDYGSQPCEPSPPVAAAEDTVTAEDWQAILAAPPIPLTAEFYRGCMVQTVEELPPAEPEPERLTGTEILRRQREVEGRIAAIAHDMREAALRRQREGVPIQGVDSLEDVLRDPAMNANAMRTKLEAMRRAEDQNRIPWRGRPHRESDEQRERNRWDTQRLIRLIELAADHDFIRNCTPGRHQLIAPADWAAEP